MSPPPKPPEKLETGEQPPEVPVAKPLLVEGAKELEDKDSTKTIAGMVGAVAGEAGKQIIKGFDLVYSNVENATTAAVSALTGAAAKPEEAPAAVLPVPTAESNQRAEERFYQELGVRETVMDSSGDALRALELGSPTPRSTERTASTSTDKSVPPGEKPRAITPEEIAARKQYGDYGFVDQMSSPERSKWLASSGERTKYQNYENMVKSGYYGFVDKMSEGDRAGWLQTASAEQRIAYANHQDRVKNGDFSAIDKLEGLQFAAVFNNMTEAQRQGLRDFQTRTKAGDYSFVDRINDANRAEFYRNAKDDVFNRRLDYVRLRAEGDYGFVDRMDGNTRKDWLATASEQDRQRYDDYSKKTKTGDYGHVDNLSAESREAWERQANDAQRSEYKTYKDRVSNGDYSFLDKQSEAAIKTWMDKASPEQRQGYEDFSVRKQAGDYSFVDKLGAEAQKSWQTDQGYVQYKEDTAVGDYGFVNRLDSGGRPDLADKWYQNASPEEQNAYVAYEMGRTSGSPPQRPPADTTGGTKPETKPDVSDREKPADGPKLPLLTTEQQRAAGDLSFVERMSAQQREAYFENKDNKLSKEQFETWQELRKVGYYGDVASYPEDQLKQWKETASEVEKLGLKNHLDRKEAGDYSWVDHLTPKAYEIFKLQSSDEDWFGYNDYRDRIDKGDFTFMEKLNEANKDNWRDNSTDQDYKAYTTYLERTEHGDFGFVDKLSSTQLARWKENAPQSSQVGYANYQNKIKNGDFSFVDSFHGPDDKTNWLAGASTDLKQGYDAYQAKIAKGDFSFVSKLNPENQEHFAEGNPELRQQYNEYTRRQSGDLSAVDRMAPEDRSRFLENPANKTAYDNYQDNVKSGNFTFLDNLSAESRAAYLKENPQYEQSYKFYQERLAAGDYSHLDKVSPANFESWLKSATLEEAEKYYQHTERQFIGDYSWVDRLSEANRTDWLTTATEHDAKGYATYSQAVKDGDFSFVQYLSPELAQDFIVRSTDLQYAGYKAFLDLEDRKKAGDYGFVDDMDQASFDRWLNKASEADQKAYLTYRDNVESGNLDFLDRLSKDNFQKWAEQASYEELDAYADYLARKNAPPVSSDAPVSPTPPAPGTTPPVPVSGDVPPTGTVPPAASTVPADSSVTPPPVATPDGSVTTTTTPPAAVTAVPADGATKPSPSTPPDVPVTAAGSVPDAVLPKAANPLEVPPPAEAPPATIPVAGTLPASASIGKPAPAPSPDLQAGTIPVVGVDGNPAPIAPPPVLPPLVAATMADGSVGKPALVPGADPLLPQAGKPPVDGPELSIRDQVKARHEAVLAAAAAANPPAPTGTLPPDKPTPVVVPAPAPGGSTTVPPVVPAPITPGTAPTREQLLASLTEAHNNLKSSVPPGRPADPTGSPSPAPAGTSRPEAGLPPPEPKPTTGAPPPVTPPPAPILSASAAADAVRQAGRANDAAATAAALALLQQATNKAEVKPTPPSDAPPPHVVPPVVPPIASTTPGPVTDRPAPPTLPPVLQSPALDGDRRAQVAQKIEEHKNAQQNPIPTTTPPVPPPTGTTVPQPQVPVVPSGLPQPTPAPTPDATPSRDRPQGTNGHTTTLTQAEKAKLEETAQSHPHHQPQNPTPANPPPGQPLPGGGVGGQQPGQGPTAPTTGTAGSGGPTGPTIPAGQIGTGNQQGAPAQVLTGGAAAAEAEKVLRRSAQVGVSDATIVVPPVVAAPPVVVPPVVRSATDQPLQPRQGGGSDHVGSPAQVGPGEGTAASLRLQRLTSEIQQVLARQDVSDSQRQALQLRQAEIAVVQQKLESIRSNPSGGSVSGDLPRSTVPRPDGSGVPSRPSDGTIPRPDSGRPPSGERPAGTPADGAKPPVIGRPGEQGPASGPGRPGDATGPSGKPVDKLSPDGAVPKLGAEKGEPTKAGEKEAPAGERQAPPGVPGQAGQQIQIASSVTKPGTEPGATGRARDSADIANALSGKPDKVDAAGRDVPGRPGEVGVGLGRGETGRPDGIVKGDLTKASEKGEQPGRTELGSRGEIPGRGEAVGRADLTGRGEINVPGAKDGGKGEAIGRETTKDGSLRGEQLTAGKPGEIRIAVDGTTRGADVVVPGAKIAPADKGMPLAAESGKGAQAQAGPAGGPVYVSSPGGKADGKAPAEKGGDIPAELPTTKQTGQSPSIGLSQMGTTAPTNKPVQKDPQQGSGPQGATTVPLQQVTLPTVQITGIDPNNPTGAVTATGQPVIPATNQAVNAAGQPVNAAGQPVNAAGQPVNAAGQPATAAAGQPATAAGQPVNAAGQPVNAAGQPATAAGQPVNAAGQPVNAAGQPVNAAGQPVNAAGQPVNAAGQPAGAAGQPAGAAGQPVNAAGQPATAAAVQPVSAAGQPVSAAGQPVINAAGQPVNAAGQPVINAAGQPVINAAGQPATAAAGQPATAAAGQTVGATGIPATSASGQTGSPVTANGLPIATSTGATVSATGHPVSATGQTTNPSGQPVSSTTGQAASSTGEPTPPSSGQATNSAGQPVASNTAQSTNSGGQPISSTTGQPGNSNTTDHAPTTSPPLSTSVQPAATSSELKEELELLGWTALPDVTPTVAPHIEATTTATEVHSSKPDAWWTPLPILDEQGQSENNPPSTSAPSNAPASREPDLNDHRTVPAATENTEHRAVPDQPNSRRLTELPDGRTSVWDIPDHSTSPHTNSSAVSTNNERSEWEADPNEWSTPATANNNNVIVGTNSGVVTDPQSPNTNVPLTNEPQWSDVVLGTGIGNIFAGGLGSLVDGLAGPSTTNTSNTTNNNDHRTVPESTVNDNRTVPEPTVNDHRTVQDLPDNRIITELPGGRTSVWDIPDRSHETAPTGNSSNNSSISASGTRPNWEAAPDEWAPPAPTVTDHRTAPQSNNNDRTVPETVNDHRTVPETTVNDHRTVPDLPDNRTITELPGGRTSVWDIPDRSNETPTGSNTTNHLAPGTKPEWEADPDEWAPPPPTPVHNPNQGDGTQGNGPKDGIGWGNLPPIGNVPDPQPHSGWPTGSPPVVGQGPDSGGTVHNEPAAPSSPSTSPPAPPQSSASTHPDTPPAANNSSVHPVADGTASSSGAPQETTTYPYNGAGPTPGPIDFTPGRPDGIFDASPGRADQIAAEMALLELLNAMANNANANDANKGAKSGEPPVGPATPNTPPSNRVETIDQISGAGRLPPGDNTRQPELTDAPAADHKLHLPEKLAPLEQILNQLPGIDRIADLLNLQEQTHKPDQDLPVVNPLAIVNEIMAPIIDPERSDRTHGTAQNPLAESANLNALGDKIEEIIAGGIHNSTHSHQDATLLSVDQLVEALRHNDGGSAIDPQQLINNVIDNTFTSPQGLDITSGMIDELSLPEAISNMGGRIGPHILNQSTDPDNVIPQIEYDLDSAMANALLDAEQHQTDIASAIDEIIYGEQPPVDLYDNMLDGKLEEPLAEAFLEEQIEKEKRRIKELREKEDEERKEREERLREEEAKRYAAAMLAALKARQAQEQANRIRRQQEQEAAKAEIRQRYIVMPGDTLESIAQKRLYNKRLAPLIFELNRGKIPVKIQDGKKLLQLRAKTVLLLPSTADVKRFHSRVFGRSTEKFEYDPDCVEEAKTNTGSASGFPFLSDDTVAAPFVPRSFTGRKTDANGNVTGKSNTDPQGVPLPSATKKRRDNVEAMLGKVQETSPGDEGRIKYICRLGDSLRSIAINHPALRDVSLWRLVAEINGLSSETNGKGVPVAELKRGEKILLPLPSEIVAHRQLKRAESSTKNTLGQIVSKPCTHCHRLAVQTATICPGCGTTFESSGSDSLPHEHYGPVRQQSVAHQYGLNTTDIAETVDPPLIDLSSDEAAIERALKAMPSRSQLLDVADTVATGEFSPLSPNRPPGKIPVPSERHTAIHPVDAGMRSEDRHSTGERTGARNVITQISDECRVVTYGNFDDSAVGFRTRLEFKQREFWLPVTMYEINADTTWRHEYNPGGSRKTSRIYLPAVQAKQLAINDLEKNWESYVRPFRKPE